jgi:hypothetical protein
MLPWPIRRSRPPTRQRHIEVIPGPFRYRACALDSARCCKRMPTPLYLAARTCGRPVQVLSELVERLRRERVVLPGCTSLHDLVRGALAFERKRLAGALEGISLKSHESERSKILSAGHRFE